MVNTTDIRHYASTLPLYKLLHYIHGVEFGPSISGRLVAEVVREVATTIAKHPPLSCNQ